MSQEDVDLVSDSELDPISALSNSQSQVRVLTGEWHAAAKKRFNPFVTACVRCAVFFLSLLFFAPRVQERPYSVCLLRSIK